MKTLPLVWLFAAMAAFWVAPDARAAGSSRSVMVERGGGPVLFSMQGRRMTVLVPQGVGRLLVEERGENGWRALRSVRGVTAGTFEIQFARAIPQKRLRVWGFADASGETPEESGSGTPEETRFFDLGTVGGGGLIGRGSVGIALASGGDAGAESGVPSKEVVEPDLWSRRGSRLYFFNPYRGLQILDVKNPDAPALLGAVRVGIEGESLFVLPGGEAVLVGQRRGLWKGGGAGSSVLVAGESGILAEVEVEGWIQESRMVGTTLYVAAGFSRWENNAWKGGTEITAIDLRRPSSPVVLNTLRIEGWGSVVAATPDYLLVAVTDAASWNRSAVHVVKISEGVGALSARGVARLGGVVGDRFKLSVAGGVLRAVSEVSRRNAQGRWETVSRLETFDLKGAGELPRLGVLDLAPGERLYATRFEADRAYVVTFFQVDPLWVVDLSDPARPAVTGHLEVPGFSTHIEPVGDLLVTVGYLDWATAVSLFDVSDPARPKTLGQVTLEGYSEATGEDKAFTVLKDRGLALVPTVSGWGDGKQGAVRLVQFGPDGLRVRGVVEGRFHPRRTMALGERIAAISATLFLTVDASNLDRPEIASEVALAWPVDRVFVAGDALLAMDDGRSGAGTGAGITVGTRANPDEVLGGLALEGGTVLGATMKDGRVYVLQGDEEGVLALTVCDAGALPDLKVLGRARAAGKVARAVSARAHWLASGGLVWELSGVWPFWGGDVVPMKGDVTAGQFGVSRIGIPGFYWWGESAKRLVGCAVSDPERLQIGPVVELPAPAKGFWQTCGSAAVAGDRVFVSRRVFADWGVVVPMGKPGLPVYAPQHWLDVADFSEVSNPVLAAPVNIPGELVGTADEGALIFSISEGFRSEKGEYKGTTLQASSFDGKVAGLLGVASVPGASAARVAQVGPRRFVVACGPDEALGAGLLVKLRWNGSGWERVREVPVDPGITSLRSFGNKLGAAWGWPSAVGLFDLSDLKLRAKGAALGWAPPDLRVADVDTDGVLWVPYGLYGVIGYRSE